MAQAQFGVKAAGPSAGPEAGSTATDPGGLWAALAVNHAAIRRRDASEPYIEFTLVNDGKATVDPKLGESRPRRRIAATRSPEIRATQARSRADS